MFELPPDITKEWIRERVSDEEVFSRYLGIEVTLNYLFKSPLRDDHNPTCSFYISRSGVLRMTDFSGYFSGDCFNLVQFIYNVNFHTALKIIAEEFKLVNSKIKKKSKEYVKKIPKDKSKFDILSRQWNNIDKEYWMQYGIKEELLNYYNICPVRAVYTNNKLIYSYHKNNPGYGYIFDKNETKIYFPKANKTTQVKFLGNTNVLQGYSQLPKEGKYLIITKSLKDVMVLYNFGIAAVAPQSESQILSDEQYGEFCERFDYVFSLYDFDYIGVKSANKMKKEYGIKPLFLTNGRFKSFDYGAKDISDFISSLGSKIKNLQIRPTDRQSKTSPVYSWEEHLKRLILSKKEVGKIRPSYGSGESDVPF